MEPFNSWVARGRGGVAYETFARGSNGKAERQNYYDYGHIRRVHHETTAQGTDKTRRDEPFDWTFWPGTLHWTSWSVASCVPKPLPWLLS
jgi:hypothetical protein